MTQEAVQTTTVCYIHPDRETMLRCNRCERPICTECAVLTPTGYRCKNCVRNLQKVYETAQWSDYPLAFISAAILALLGSWIASVMGFFTIFIAPVAGVLTAEVVRAVIRRRRSKRLFQVATAGAIVGALPLLLVRLIFVVWGFSVAGIEAGGSLLGLLWPGIYVFLVASTVYYRLSGIQIR